ncbi:MAG: hypothetical protein IJ607_07545 [Bacteroidaceae bacterium]|nr:hypothetical protein [Bacteroidaceae bacterium]
MSAIDDELMQGAAEDAAEIEYIRNYLPQELKEKYSDDDLYYILDVIIEYYTQNGVFDAAPDDEGYVEIDLDKAVDYVVKKAKKEHMGDYDPDDVLLVVQADFDYNEGEEGEE